MWSMSSAGRHSMVPSSTQDAGSVDGHAPAVTRHTACGIRVVRLILGRDLIAGDGDAEVLSSSRRRDERGRPRRLEEDAACVLAVVAASNRSQGAVAGRFLVDDVVNRNIPSEVELE